MEEIISYRTEDGKLFESKDECLEHEKILAIKQFFEEMFNKHSTYDSVNEDDFINDILTKRSILKVIL